MILEEETFKRFGYLPSTLAQRSGKPILATCDGCDKVRETTKHDYHSFCNSCTKKLKMDWCGTKNPKWKGGGENVVCKQCGKKIRIRVCYVKERGNFCSYACMGKWYSENRKGKNSKKWRRVKKACVYCGKTFWAKKDEIEKGYGKFCSRKCYGKWRSEDEGILNHLREMGTHILKPTRPELIFKKICDQNNLDFHYVGNGQLWIGKNKKLNPDFIEANGKTICVEIMGAYWHSPLLNHNLREGAIQSYREKHYRKYKWTPIFIWDTDLLRPDAEDFVLSELKKGGAL